MTTVVCPGSFDPPTLGHLDVVERAARLFDEVVVAVVVNPNKQGTFTVPERMELFRAALGDTTGVRLDSTSGLLVDYCREVGATAVVKGLRAPADYEYETPMAHMNRHIAGIETVFLATRPDLSFVSSSLCREVAALGGDVTDLVPPVVAEALTARFGTPTPAPGG